MQNYERKQEKQTRASQIWFFRYDAIVNLQRPWVCLDASQAMLGLAKFSGHQDQVIDAIKAKDPVENDQSQNEDDNSSFVLICPAKNTYISNKLCPISGQVMTVQNGLFNDVSWLLLTQTNPEALCSGVVEGCSDHDGSNLSFDSSKATHKLDNSVRTRDRSNPFTIAKASFKDQDNEDEEAEEVKQLPSVLALQMPQGGRNDSSGCEVLKQNSLKDLFANMFQSRSQVTKDEEEVSSDLNFPDQLQQQFGGRLLSRPNNSIDYFN